LGYKYITTLLRQEWEKMQEVDKNYVLYSLKEDFPDE